jgi:hypothetical protein
MEIVYLGLAVGYDINTSESQRIADECDDYKNSQGEKVDLLSDKGEFTYVGLSSTEYGDLGCGDLLELDLSKATVGEAGTGTGLYEFPVEGLFEISRLGRWNDSPRIYRLRGIDAPYGVIAAAKKMLARQ